MEAFKGSAAFVLCLWPHSFGSIASWTFRNDVLLDQLMNNTMSVSYQCRYALFDYGAKIDLINVRFRNMRPILSACKLIGNRDACSNRILSSKLDDVAFWFEHCNSSEFSFRCETSVVSIVNALNIQCAQYSIGDVIFAISYFFYFYYYDLSKLALIKCSTKRLTN